MVICLKQKVNRESVFRDPWAHRDQALLPPEEDSLQEIPKQEISLLFCYLSLKVQMFRAEQWRVTSQGLREGHKSLGRKSSSLGFLGLT